MQHVTLAADEIADFKCLAGIMIPASAEYGVPGADDAAISADMLGTLGRDGPDVRTALESLAIEAGGRFAALDAERREAVAEAWRARGGAAVGTLNRVVLQCYYRDPRVVRALGREPRAPFPKGNTLEQGDWSLLDPVRERPPFWRPVS